MAVETGPIVFTAAAQVFMPKAKISGIIWEGATAPGNQCELAHNDGADSLLWVCRTDGSNTYRGIAFGIKGQSAPNGIKVLTLSAGRVLVYLMEP